LHLLQHAQQERFALSCSFFAGLGHFQLLTQQVALQAQQVTFLLHSTHSLCFLGNMRVERCTGAGCCILERSRSGVERAPLEREAGTQQFSGVETAIRVSTQAPGTDGTVQGGACYTCDT